MPRPKERLARLGDIAPGAAALLSIALREAPAAALGALQLAAEQVLGATGFFEWDSGPDHAAPPGP